ncbi:hypothetical protein E4U21_006635 [Claviceps maximensis]|nr:hypothetical protein E4U21_006635 [Claviceps maximensis]
MALGQRHKKSHSKQSRPRMCDAEDDLRGTSSLSSLLSPLTSLPSDFLAEPCGIADDRVNYKTSWIDSQPAAAEAAEGLPIEPWHMGFTAIGGGDQVNGVLRNQSEILSNKVIEGYGNNQSYMHHASAGGYPMCSTPFSHLDLSIIKEDGEYRRGISRSLSSSNQALGGDHSLDLEVSRGKGDELRKRDKRNMFKSVR